MMAFTFADTLGLLAAVMACGLVLVAPGYALARFLGLSRDGRTPDPLTGVVVGLAVLPALDSVAVRLFGLDAALGATLSLAAVALVLARRAGAIERPSRVGLAFVGCWLVILTVEWVDFDVAGKLYQPLTIFDSVKHAATTQAIYDSGAPPRDAFFLRPERSSYYYFFYTIAALAMRLCGGLVDAKAAVGGVAFWTGIGVYGLIRLVMARAGLVISDRRRPWLIVAVLAAGGLDVLAMPVFAASRHYWIADPLRWNEQIGAWFEDVLWVPHHVTGLIAGMVGLVALCDAMGEPDRPATPRNVVAARVTLAGVAFASALGLSVWVTLGFVVTVVAWGAILLVERRWKALGLVVLAGGVALLIAVPQILDLKAGRSSGGPFPIVPTVRAFGPVELLMPETSLQFLVDFLTLPLNYAIEFGVVALGSLVYWRQRRAGAFGGGEFSRVLAVAAVAGLLLGGFLRSTLLLNNDLGWRVLLLPLLAGTVWTIAALDRLIEAPAATRPALRPFGAPLFYAMLGVGWITVLYTAVLMRAYPFITVNPGARFMAADPATERALRVAYGWASGHLPPSAVLQQNPTFKRAFAFGVYGRHQTGVADSFGSLYGADPRAVLARVDSLGPIFKTDLPVSDIGARATANGIDDLIVTAADPVWSLPESFVWRVKPVFASARVRIIPVVTLEAAR